MLLASPWLSPFLPLLKKTKKATIVARQAFVGALDDGCLIGVDTVGARAGKPGGWGSRVRRITGTVGRYSLSCHSSNPALERVHLQFHFLVSTLEKVLTGARSLVPGHGHGHRPHRGVAGVRIS